MRKDRKSGFLTPSIALNFFDTKTSQSTSFPYYFNINIDKELLFTPIINYGGGVDASQRFIFDYNQILSGGNFKTDLTLDSNFENKNTIIHQINEMVYIENGGEEQIKDEIPKVKKNHCSRR